MPKKPLPPSKLETALIAALEFIRIVVEAHPRTREQVLTAMDLNDEAFDDEIDTLENMLASLGSPAGLQYERIVPRLGKTKEPEE